MPRYIDTSDIVDGNDVFASPIANALETLDAKLAELFDKLIAIGNGAEDMDKIPKLNSMGIVDSSMLPLANGDWSTWQNNQRSFNLHFHFQGLYEGGGWAVSAVPDSMNVSVEKGVALVDGIEYMPSTDQEATVPASDPTDSRVDLVVLRRAQDNSVSPVVIAGTPGGAKATKQPRDVALYEVTVPANAANLNGATFFDVREWATGEEPVAVLPVGSVTPYAGSTAPSGWALCYGQAISRETYADLFEAIGTTYGSGDGSTTFNLPDLRGRTPAGLDNMGGSSANRVTDAKADTLGGAIGVETHTLTASEIPAHNHQQSLVAPSHYSSISAIVPIQSADVRSTILDLGTAVNIGREYSANKLNTQNNTGGGGAHNNVQPTFFLNYIIYHGVVS